MININSIYIYINNMMSKLLLCMNLFDRYLFNIQLFN